MGYSRLVRVGSFVYVSGTTAADEQGGAASESAYHQTTLILTRIKDALAQVGARLEDVVRTRIYVIDIDDWPEIGRAHAEFFGEVHPAASMVEVRRLISPGLLVEIEADAVVSGD